jgi:hypothetical protein
MSIPQPDADEQHINPWRLRFFSDDRRNNAFAATSSAAQNKNHVVSKLKIMLAQSSNVTFLQS